MGKRPYEEIGGVRFYDNPLVDGVTDRRVFVTEPPPKKGATPVKRGVEFDCSMFDVHCTQECVSGGLRHTDKCPYDNYNTKSNKRSDAMAKNNNSGGGFQKTFVKYSDMNEREKGIFKQGATTANNNVKERLGLKKPRPDNKNK